MAGVYDKLYPIIDNIVTIRPRGHVSKNYRPYNRVSRPPSSNR